MPVTIDVKPAPPPACPACAEKRLHTEAEWTEHHPYRGHGYTPETGWSKQPGKGAA